MTEFLASLRCSSGLTPSDRLKKVCHSGKTKVHGHFETASPEKEGGHDIMAQGSHVNASTLANEGGPFNPADRTSAKKVFVPREAAAVPSSAHNLVASSLGDMAGSS